MTEAGPAGDQIWRRLAERAVGAGIESLTSRSLDGLEIAPLHRRLASDPAQPRRPAAAWSVAQRIDHPVPETANTLALRDLEGGADALVLVGAESPYSRGFGQSLAEAEDLRATFAGVELDFIDLRLDAGPAAPRALAALVELVVSRRLTSATLQVDIGYDPIGCHARLGTPAGADPRSLLDARGAAGLGGTLFLADGRPYHEAGASEAQELAAVLATAIAYLRRLEATGLTLDAARGLIGVLLAADADVFVGLAKVRALRRLWTRVEHACGLMPRPIRLHAETSWRMMTRRDPWTNVMRATAATFAAGLGGADTVTVLPLTLAAGLPDEAARRLARNVQRVLLDEAHLAAVADPAAGAGGFEALTEGLCAAAWAQFQEIEREGGIETALPRLKTRIAATAARRANDIAHFARGIVGTSCFPSLDSPPIPVLLDAVPQAPGPLPVLRESAPFEDLRDLADAARPEIRLVTLGTPASFGPRVSLATNFFAAAGIAAATGEPAGAGRLACLCGSDAAYAADAAAALASLPTTVRRIFLVGRPDPAIPGIDACIHAGCDALAILRDALDAAI